MKIPIFEEIILSDHTPHKMKSHLEESRVGTVPTYINLSQIKKEDTITLVQHLEDIFSELNFHPRFPYPTYIVTKFSFDSIFPLVKTARELPEHFFKKVKRANNKELQLLNKLSLKVDKINNLELIRITEQFNETRFTQRKLYELSKELHFLETINEQIFEKQKKEKV